MGIAKIAFLSANEHVPWGGSEECWAKAAERLVRSGVAVSVSVMDFGEPVKQVEQLRSAGCRIVHRKLPNLTQRLRRHLLRSDYPRMQVEEVSKDAELVAVAVGGTNLCASIAACSPS